MCDKTYKVNISNQSLTIIGMSKDLVDLACEPDVILLNNWIYSHTWLNKV